VRRTEAIPSRSFMSTGDRTTMARGRIVPLGTSRLHRAFSRRDNKDVVRHQLDGWTYAPLHIGYLHTTSEAVQAARFVTGRLVLPGSVTRLVFRKEPVFTTPDNEFDRDLEAALLSGADVRPQSLVRFQDTDIVVVEVSSLSVHRHASTGFVVHANPNLHLDKPYSEIYPEGFYAKFAPELGVERCEAKPFNIHEDVLELKELVAPARLVLMSHIHDDSPALAARHRLHRIVSDACARTGTPYIDTAPILREHGFAQSMGKADIHHLSPSGESALATRIVCVAESLIKEPAAPPPRSTLAAAPARNDAVTSEQKASGITSAPSAGQLAAANREFRAGNFAASRRLYADFQTKNPELAAVVQWNLGQCDHHLRNTTGSNQAERGWLSRHFDEVYLVNLPAQTADRLSALKHLSEHAIEPRIWDATNGYVGEPAEVYRKYSTSPLGSLKRYASHNAHEIRRGSHYINSAGAVGYIYTYIAILKDAIARKLDRILILEDDVTLHPAFARRLQDLLRRVGPDWKVLQLGASQYGWDSVNISEAEHRGFYHPRMLDTCGSFAMGLSRTIFEPLIEAVSSFEAPLDHLPLGEIYERHLGECFVCYPNIVMPDVRSSSIRGPRDQIEHGKRMKWDVAAFKFPNERPKVAVVANSEASVRYVFPRAGEIRAWADLRLYASSADGYRPMHSSPPPGGFEFVVDGSEEHLPLEAVDVLIQPEPGYCLTEQDIIDCLEARFMQTRSRTSPRITWRPGRTMMQVNGRASVIIPTFRRSENLAHAIRSVATQDYHDIEIVVVSDNGRNMTAANDAVASIVNSAASQFQNITFKLIHHKSNRNGAAARNTGLWASSGEYVSFLDDDDEYLQGRLSKVITELRKQPASIGGAFCGFFGWNSPVNDLGRYAVENQLEYLLALDYKRHYFSTNTVTYRRQVLLDVNGFDESFRRHQDIELNARVLQRYAFAPVRECLARIRPIPTDVDNRVFDMAILELKEKFLGTFRGVIDSLDPAVAKSIYERHWQEVTRNVKDTDSVVDRLRSDPLNGRLLVAMELMQRGRQSAQAPKAVTATAAA
jgi:glycosyltransferase involved in cell wall biosynthesis/GR25 family glycosyltransferase involved in LPS biosynthesis